MDLYVFGFQLALDKIIAPSSRSITNVLLASKIGLPLAYGGPPQVIGPLLERRGEIDVSDVDRSEGRPEMKRIHRNKDQAPGIPQAQGRRDFLRGGVLATVASVADLPPLIGVGAGADAGVDSGFCSDPKAPMKDVAGKVAFITGGSSGIGLGIAKAFADAGMKVVLANRTDKHLEEAMKILENARDRVHAIKVDVTDRPGMEKAAAEAVKLFGKVHVLVNNAGVVVPKTVSQTTYEDWDWVMNVNLTGVFNGVRTFLPVIRSHGEGGHVITTSSTLGMFVWGDSEGVYPASKFAVTALMESLRAEMLGTNIGVSVFCPGWVSTNLGFTSRDAHPGGAALSGIKLEPAEDAKVKKEFAGQKIFMNSIETGRLVLRGMRANQLYILSHPEWKELMRARHAAMMASLPKDIHPNEERLTKAREMTRASIYAAELDRKSC